MDELARRFADLAAQYGPPVIDAGKHAAQVEGYSTLVSSVQWGIAAGIIYLCGKHVRDWSKKADEYDRGPVTAIGAVLQFVGLILLLPMIWTWIDPWTWTAINHPEIWIAHQILRI